MDDDSLLTIATAYALQTGGDYVGAYRKFGMEYPSLPYGNRFREWLNTPNVKPYFSRLYH